MPNIVLVGAQWGDEGKGKVIDMLTERTDIAVRFQGGNNAGHTVVETDKGSTAIDGTLFTRSDPRIVRINEFYVDAVPAGAMLIVRNQDKPGMVGRIGTILGSHKVNIGWMTLGRNNQGGPALLVLNVDQIPSETMLAEIQKLPDIVEVKLIKL